MLTPAAHFATQKQPCPAKRLYPNFWNYLTPSRNRNLLKPLKSLTYVQISPHMEISCTHKSHKSEGNSLELPRQLFNNSLRQAPIQFL